MEVRTW
jgi:hypothetical protein